MSVSKMKGATKVARPVERSFRLPPEIARGVEQLAQKDSRSMNNMAAVLLREALVARGALLAA